MIDLTIPAIFLVGALFGAGIVGGAAGWYLAKRDIGKDDDA